MPRLRMYLVALTAIAVTVAVGVAAPAGSAHVATTGAQLLVGLPCSATPCISTFPAGEPFFVSHGFTDQAKASLVNPATRYELSVDGVRVASAVDLDLFGPETARLNVTNFRFGMTGVHVFVGCWYLDGVFVTCAQRTVTFV